jgi:hypothetical protein
MGKITVHVPRLKEAAKINLDLGQMKYPFLKAMLSTIAAIGLRAFSKAKIWKTVHQECHHDGGLGCI